MQPSTQPAGGAQPAQQPATAGQQQGLSPEQMKKMQMLTRQGMGFLLEGDHAEQIVAQAKQGEPQQVATSVVVELMSRLYEAGNAAGQLTESPEDVVVLLVAGLQLTGELAEMLVAGGVLQESEAQAFVAEVAQMAIQRHNVQVQQQGGGQSAQPQQQPPAAPAAGNMIGGA